MILNHFQNKLLIMYWNYTNKIECLKASQEISSKIINLTNQQNTHLLPPPQLSLWPYSSFPNLDIKNHTLEYLQNKWIKLNTKLNEIKRSIIPWLIYKDNSWSQGTINSWLIIEHTSLTYRYLMIGEDRTICNNCGVELTV